jgi:GntR family transcriptional regulator
MKISLNPDSEVPLRQQLSEQIVFLITSGALRAGEEMPSVRALARRTNVHHNTISKAYQELVRREWLTRKPGSRLVVGTLASAGQRQDPALDEVINETIQRAKALGYTLQALRSRVRERLLDEPADHLLVVEHDQGLREIIRHEVEERLHRRTECCSYAEIVREPGLAIGAQVLAPEYIVQGLKPFLPVHRPCMAIQYSGVEEHITIVRALREPSVIAVASVSESLLKTARSLLAPSIGREHTYQDVLLSTDRQIDVRKADLVFCDSVALSRVSCRQKFHYQLVSPDTLQELSTSLLSEA